MARSRGKNIFSLFSDLDSFSKFMVLSMILIIIAVPYIINHYQNSSSSAAVRTMTGTIALNQTSGVTFGSTVTFTTTYPKTTKNPEILVSCYQNGQLVYGQLDHTTTSFVLGGGSSQWVTNGGGPANCTAQLYDYGPNYHNETITLLASTAFNAQ